MRILSRLAIMLVALFLAVSPSLALAQAGGTGGGGGTTSGSTAGGGGADGVYASPIGGPGSGEERARVFANASRREDHGLSQLEALAAGCALVTVPSPGSYEALPLARELAPELVAADVSAGALARSLRAGLDLRARDAYAARSLELLRPFRADAIREVLASQVLPALGVR